MSEDQKIVHIHLSEDETFKTICTAGRHEITADEPESVKGGNDAGPDPYDMLLMSLGSCTLMTVKMYARQKKWEIGDLYLELRHNKRHMDDCRNCEKDSSKIDVIEKELIIKNHDLSEDQLEKLLDISKKCPVHRTMEGNITIESSLSIDG